MSLYLDERGNFRPWDGREKIRGISYQPNIGDLWTADELASLGLYEPVRPAVPRGKVVASERVARVDDVVTFVYTLESVPLPDLNRIQFEFMVEKLGIGAAIEQAIAAMPEDTEPAQNAKILARVLYRSGQTFERSHPLFTELAPAVGFTPEQIDAAWIGALTV